MLIKRIASIISTGTENAAARLMKETGIPVPVPYLIKSGDGVASNSTGTGR
jgi:hypothetical protein